MLNKNTEKYNKFAGRNGVAIPIIQRDYVQGADVNFEKRDKFIKKLLDDGLISLCEYDKISALNREKLCPFMAELIA